MGQVRIRPLFQCHVLKSTLWNMPESNNSEAWARSPFFCLSNICFTVNFFSGYHICSRGFYIFLPTNRQRLHICCKKGHIFYQCDQSGELAQMVERSLSMWEVGGSIPPFSKLFFPWKEESAENYFGRTCVFRLFCLRNIWPKMAASSGNRTRAARVAGEHSTTEPTMLAQGCSNLKAWQRKG